MATTKAYKAGVISVCIGYSLIFCLAALDLPQMVFALLLFISFGLLGYAYKTILIRKELPPFFVAFGGFGVLFFWGGMLALLFELIGYLLEVIFL